ncbi:hypothetical protein [Methylotenera sp. L2L1]|uniref:hypothetical protein n=1 Tax=Methylotenera sp. L2L1 TaxID=1502770 RepID=UPI00068CA88E|nr:hypothetical protein [Methylotenera sp. L2L1]
MKNNNSRTKAFAIGVSIITSFYSLASVAESQFSHALNGNNLLGLYRTNQFQLNQGACKNCAITPQASWYFEQETIAIPLSNAHSFDPTLSAQDDVKQWVTSQSSATNAMPPLVWLGSPHVAVGKLSQDGKFMQSENSKTPLSITPKIESNQSYYNQASEQHFAGRNLVMHGTAEQTHFTARSIWPLDYNLDLNQIPYKPLADQETIASLIRDKNGGASAPFSARILYKNPNLTSLQNKPVLSFVLNGAQGDDDEAHGGHFAVATGRFGAQGEWQDWLVNNFYNLGSVSEKGIIAASLPMDSYQGDLNSGQSWYRPSYMLVAVLKNERSAATYQSAINRVMQHFYRQDFLYRHAGVNCAGINLETLRSLDWNIPKLGATNLPKAFAALPYKALSDMNLESGLKAYDYLSAEQTNLYPFVAFETIGNDLLSRIAKNQANSAFEKQLAEDLEAIIYVHIPQFPSSRAMGQAPVASLDEYIARTPADMSQWKIIPVGARDFPDALKDKNAPAEPLRPAYYGLIAWFVILMLALLGMRNIFRKLRKS